MPDGRRSARYETCTPGIPGPSEPAITAPALVPRELTKIEFGDDGNLLLYEGADAAASPVLIGRHVSADSTAYNHRVMQIVLSKDGRYLASEGGWNIIVWDLAGRRHIRWHSRLTATLRRSV